MSGTVLKFPYTKDVKVIHSLPVSSDTSQLPGRTSDTSKTASPVPLVLEADEVATIESTDELQVFPEFGCHSLIIRLKSYWNGFAFETMMMEITSSLQ